MADLAQLRRDAARARDELDRARRSYVAASRRHLIAELLKFLAEAPQVVALELSAEYEYDDEGGYFRYLSGSSAFADDTACEDQLEDYWTEGLDVEQAVILDLFGIDGVGEGALTRKDLCALAVTEGIASAARSSGASAALATAREGSG